MAELSGYLITFNCGRELVDTEYFSKCLYNNLSKRDTPPELLILALQEVAPISYSFLGGSFVSPYFDRLTTAVQSFAQSWDQTYESVSASNVGMTAIMVFALPNVASKIRWIETGGTGVGMHEMGNKGAVGLRLGYGGAGEVEVEMTFVAAHLAPMEEACQRRNDDWKAINENLVFGRATKSSMLKPKSNATSAEARLSEEAEPLLSSATNASQQTSEDANRNALLKPTSYLFFAGDLNYRTSDKKPGPDDHTTFPQPTSSSSDPKHHSHLFQNDQLNREKKAKRTLHGLEEAPITFHPTYKYSSKARDLAAQRAKATAAAASSSKDSATASANANAAAETDDHWYWAEHRYPSWCDRILFREPSLAGTTPVIHAYTSLPLQPTSDHQPVALDFSVPLKSLAQIGEAAEAWEQVPFRVQPGWKQRRDAARRKEILVGAMAYLALTWEGEAVLVGTLLALVGAVTAFRSFLV